MPKRLELTGKQYDRLTVIGPKGIDKNGRTLWECKCKCGGKKIVTGTKLRSKDVTSCGCKIRERFITHGMHGTKIYNVWKGMKARCLNPNTPHYHRYGGRGIKVCERWMTFENFYEDIKSKYSSNKSMDRIDNNGNYEPSNVKWSTNVEQGDNTRMNVKINTEKGMMNVTAAARMFGLNASTVFSRIKAGWSESELLSKPTNKWERIKPCG